MIKLEYFTKNDFNQLIEWVNDEQLLLNWSGSLFSFPLTEKKLDWYIEDVNDKEKSEAFVYKAVDTEKGIVVGHISLGGISRKNNAARISRVLVGNTTERRRGICTGMIREICRIGFEELNMHRISLGVYDFNTAAIRCYEKNGFVREGVFRDILKYNDLYWNLIEMSMLEDEWFKLHRTIEGYQTA